MKIGNVEGKFKGITIDWENAVDEISVYRAFKKSLNLAGGLSSDSLIESITQPEDSVGGPIKFTILNCKNFFKVNGYDNRVMSMMKIIVNSQIYDFDTGKEYACEFDLVGVE